MLIDPVFANIVRAYRWYAVIGRGHIYAVADIDGKRVALQRLIVALAEGKHPNDVKHISFKNKLTFDCRLQNLVRAGTRQSSMRNRRGKRNTSSRYKGVRKASLPNGGYEWRAAIHGNDGTVELGRYDSEESAAHVYDAAARVLFKDAAHLNFPDTPSEPATLEDVRARVARFLMRLSRREKAAKRTDS